MRLRRPLLAVLLTLVFLGPSSLLAEHVSLWGGGGIGTFLSGAPNDVEGHKFGALSISLDRDRLRLRYLRGSFEREKGVARGVGDADVDYSGADVVFTGRMTHLPFEVSIGASLFKEARPTPASEAGGRVFERRWGPHVSLARSFTLWRPISVWTEIDVDYAPFAPRQVFALLDTGLGIRF